MKCSKERNDTARASTTPFTSAALAKRRRLSSLTRRLLFIVPGLARRLIIHAGPTDYAVSSSAAPSAIVNREPERRDPFLLDVSYCLARFACVSACFPRRSARFAAHIRVGWHCRAPSSHAGSILTFDWSDRARFTLRQRRTSVFGRIFATGKFLGEIDILLNIEDL